MTPSKWPQILDDLTVKCHREMILASIEGREQDVVLRRYLAEAIILGNAEPSVIEYAKNVTGQS